MKEKNLRKRLLLIQERSRSLPYVWLGVSRLQPRLSTSRGLAPAGGEEHSRRGGEEHSRSRSGGGEERIQIGSLFHKPKEVGEGQILYMKDTNFNN